MRPNKNIQRLVNYVRRLREQAASRGEVLVVVATLLAVVVVSAITLPALASAEGDAMVQPSAAEQSQQQEAGASQQPTAASQGQPQDAQTPQYQTGELTCQSQDGADDDAHYTVTATVDASAQLPAGTTLKVTEIRQDKDEDRQSYEDHRKAALAELQKQDQKISGFGALRLFDVRFVDANGNEVEPAADVTVKLSANTALETKDSSDIKVLGFQNDDDPTTNISVVDKDKVQAKLEDGKTNEVTFAAGKGCVYAVGTVQRDQTLTAEDDSYNVTLSYDGTAKLPEGVTASVTPLGTDSDEYNAAKDAVVAEKKSQDQNFDEDSLGVAALDITLRDKDGDEVEPQGNVGVKIEAKSLPDEAKDASLEVQHVEDGASQATTVASDVQAAGTSATAEFDVSGFSVFTITWTKNGGEEGRIGQVTIHYVDENGLEINRTAQMDTSQLANRSGAVLKISDWVNNDENGTRKVSGYVFQKATLEGVDGTQITGVKVGRSQDSSDNNTGYKLYYTTVENPGDTTPEDDWTPYTDSVSKAGANNADIYLVFQSTAQRVLVHYVDEDGNIIINPVYKYADQLVKDGNGGFDVSNKNVATNEWAEEIQDYSYTGRAQCGEEGQGWKGFSIKQIRAVTTVGTDENSTAVYRFEYQLPAKSTSSSSGSDTGSGTGSDTGSGTGSDTGSDTGSGTGSGTGSDTGSGSGLSSESGWVDMTGTDIYLIYRKTVGQKLITLHYIDSKGNAIKNAYGEDYTKVIDAGDLSDGVWYNIPGLGDDIDGYQRDDSTSGGDGHGIVVAREGSTVTYSNPITSGANVNIWSKTIGTGTSAVTGYAFRYIQYKTVGQGKDAKKVLYVAEGNRPSGGLSVRTGDFTTRADHTVDGNFDIYLVYAPSQTTQDYTYAVHYVDEYGNIIADSSTKQSIFSANSGNTVTIDVASLADAKSISGYTPATTSNKGFLGRPTEFAGGIPMTSITFTKGNDGVINYSIRSVNSTGTSSDTMPRQLVLHNLNIYVTYNKSAKPNDGANLTYHYVDQQGNEIAPKTETDITVNSSYYIAKGPDYWDGYTFPRDGGSTPSPNINGYSYQNYGYVGTSGNDNYKLITNGTDNNAIIYNYDSNKEWHTGIGHTNNKASATKNMEVRLSGTTPAYITDIYFVYKKTGNINVHRVYVSGTVSDTDNRLQLTKIGKTEDHISYDNLPDSSGEAINLIGTQAEGQTNYAPSPIGDDGTQDKNGKYVYAGTRVGPAWPSTGSLTYSDLGANVRGVYKDNEQLTYYGETTTSLSYLRNNTWYHAEGNGRRFELTMDTNGNYTLSDSRHGSIILNESAYNTYVGTYHGEAQTTEYQVVYTPNDNGNGGRYNLTVKDWLPSNQTDVYEIYVDSSKYKLWIEDDQMYSGYLIANKTEGLPRGTYTWYKTVTDSAGNTTTSTVLRRQTGEHYNIEYDPTARTWLDVEADEGGLNSTTQTAVSYHVTYTYTDNSGEHTLTSNSVSIPYYSELKNGGFETPDYGSKGVNKPINQVTNSAYAGAGGVWQSTGTGSEGTGKDRVENVNIEVVNTEADNHSFKGSYRWYGDAPYAEEGTQFAELNCSAAGALYQDVVTHPNEQLHYWFSHRARGQQQNSTPEYDTMYLVIMPTKLAMTGGKDGGELKSQSDLIDFVNAHGGFDYNLATSVSQEVVHAEDTDGIFILKVSSNDQFWHTVSSINGYTARAGLTRFFFMAGPTSWNGENGSRSAVENATHGNFLDDVGFSQTFPKTDGFNLSVTKTFTGLTDGQLKDLAKNVTDAEGNVTKNPNGFDIKISDRFIGNTGSTTGAPLVALNGAHLGFNVSGTDGNYIFTPTATSSNGSNLLTGNCSGTAKNNDDGSITMTWDFLDQSMADEQGDEATGEDNRFYYTVEESHAGVSDMYLASTETHSNTKKDGSETSGSGGSQYIHQGDSAVFTLSNTYSSTSASEQPQMIVTKTFTGMTPSAVDAMLPGYTLKVQKTGEGTKPSDFITLTGDKANPTKNAEGVEDATNNGSNVSATLVETANSDGLTTLRWIIKGWGAGTYSISEAGYGNGAHPIKSATVTYGGKSAISLEEQTVDGVDQRTKDGLGVGTGTTIHVGDVRSQTGDLSSIANANKPAASTNLIAAQYTLNGSTSSPTVKYFVWTQEPLSAGASEAVIDQINQSMRSGTASTVEATASNTEFHSSENPGTITVGTNDAGSISYDSQTQTLAFTGSEGLTWNQFFSARYWVGGDDSNDSGQYAGTDIAVKNSYLPAVRVQKVDDKDHTKALSGATFRLFKMDGQNKGYLVLDDNNQLAWTGNGDNALELTTNDQGFAVHEATGATALEIISQLQPGTYFIEESKAPDGYNKLVSPVAFTVSEDGIVSEPQATNGQVNGVTVDQGKVVGIDWNSPYYTITIANTAGTLLPNTGGGGIWSYVLTGLALVMLGAYWLLMRRQHDSAQI